MRAVHQPAQNFRSLAHDYRVLTLADVVAILSVSDDTILKRFGRLGGIQRHTGFDASSMRPVLRIPRRTLVRYSSDRQVKVRW